MIETGNGIAQRIDDLGLQVNDDPMKIQPLGSPAGLSVFEGVRREGGRGNNQKETLGTISWVAKNGKKILLTIDSNGINATVDGAAVRIPNGDTGVKGIVTTSVIKKYTKILDTNGFYHIALNDDGSFTLFDNTGVTWYTFPAITTDVPHLSRGGKTSIPYFTQGRLLYSCATVGATPTATGSATYPMGQYAYTKDGIRWAIVDIEVNGGVGAISNAVYTVETNTWSSIVKTSWTNNTSLPAIFGDSAYIIYRDLATNEIRQTVCSYTTNTVTTTTLQALSPGLSFVFKFAGVGCGWFSYGGYAHYCRKDLSVGDVTTVSQDVYGEMAGIYHNLNNNGVFRVLYSDTDNPVLTNNKNPLGISLGTLINPGRMISDFGDIALVTGSSVIYSPEPAVYADSGSNRFCWVNSNGEVVEIIYTDATLGNILFQDLSPSRVIIRNHGNSYCCIDTEKNIFLADNFAAPMPYIGIPSSNLDQLSTQTEINGGRFINPSRAIVRFFVDGLAFNFFQYRNQVCTNYYQTSGVSGAAPRNLPSDEIGTAYVPTDRVDFPAVPINEGLLIAGSALPISGATDYFLANEFNESYRFFRFLGGLYSFDGSTIRIANETGGGIIQGFDILAEADGLQFVAVGSDVVYFYSAYGNSLYIFDGGRAVKKLQEMPQVGDLSARISQAAFQTSASALYIPINGQSVLILKDGVFSTIRMGSVGAVAKMQETTQGMVGMIGGGQTYVNFAYLIKYPTAATTSVPVDTIRWKTSQLGLGENHRVNVRQVVYFFRVKNATLTPVNINFGYEYQTQDAQGTDTDSFSVTSSKLRNGILKVSYTPSVQAVMSFGVSFDTTLDVVLLECTVYYSPEAPAFYGPGETVNYGGV